MSLGPLVPRNNDPRSNDPRNNDPRGYASLSNEGSRGQLPGEPVEFLRPIGSALYNVLPPQESMLREYMRVLIKRKWLVIAVVVGIFMAVAVASLRQTPVYDAVGRIAVNKADSNLVAFKDSTPDTDYVYEQSDLDTEVRILQSDLMALQVIRQLNLDKRPEFGGHGDQKQANLVADPLQTDSNRTSALLAMFHGRLHVALIPNTRIMEIHFTSTDPQLAATAVNTLAATYVEQNFKTKFADESGDLAGEAGTLPEGARDSRDGRKDEHHYRKTRRTQQRNDGRGIGSDAKRGRLSPDPVQ
jgi:uncharacterized protein involved in exopolysaccharide biosynthesis